ncbi:chalcone isomerase family protein [Rickettsiales bacterium]|nr:chalcone isomerase family protein [Rickettsiales bacterium]
MRKFFLLLMAVIFLPILAFADNQKLVGQGSLYYFFWHIYDVKLYSQDGKFSFDKPFSLKLEYKRKLYGNKIADRSTEEIRGLGFKDEVKLAAWHAQMKDIFPDVNDGINLTGIYKPNQPTVFYKNNKQIGTIKDPEFGKWFFGIWLNKETSEPKLRKSLIGSK